MTTVADLVAISREPNVAAFLRVIRAGESGQSSTAYRTFYGGTLFDDLAQHPRRAIRSPWGWTSAAGAYQVVAKVEGKCRIDTEDWLLQKYGFTDFGEAQQDARAVALIMRRGALEAVRAGALEQAIQLCNREWASLPGSPYGQPRLTLERCRAVFVQFGGREGGAPAPIEVSPPTWEAPAPAPEPAPPAARSVDHVQLVGSLWKALRIGYKLINAAEWKQRQQIVNNLAVAIAAAVGIGKALGYDVPLSPEDQLGIAVGVAAVLGVFNIGTTAATSADAGVLSARRPGASGGAGSVDSGGGA